MFNETVEIKEGKGLSSLSPFHITIVLSTVLWSVFFICTSNLVISFFTEKEGAV